VKENLTMTSTTSSPCAEAATDGSKTIPSSESPGATLATNNKGAITKTGGIIRMLNDLLPYKLRPIKARRRRSRPIPNLRHEVYAFRLNWVVLYRPKLRRILKLN
jgi:hypothetical protein